VVSTADGLNRTVSTQYTPATGGPVTQTKVTNSLGHALTTTMHPALGVPTKTVDANGAVTQLTYDGAGRLLGVWAPGRDKATFPNDPSISYAYLVRKDKATAVTTKTLTGYGNATYRTSVELYDGLLRPRQSQVQTIAGGRAVTETIYDSRGNVETTSNPYYDISNAAPNTNLVTAQGRPEIPALTQNVYDGAGRQTAAIFIVRGDEKWRTSTVYAGEKTNTTPPVGGTATTTITDARGRHAELRQYKSAASVGSDTASTFDRTTYTYNKREELTKVVDAGGNIWAYGYDLHGNKTRTEDPDQGTSTSTFDVAGQKITSTDARGKTIAYTYDALGRQSSQRKATASGQKLAEWEYDTLAKGLGKLTKSTRYEYNTAGTASAYVNAVTGYDTAGRVTGTSMTLPSTEAGLCTSTATNTCEYAQSFVYTPSGELTQAKLPAIAGLAKETLLSTYNKIGLPDGLLGTQIYTQELIYNQLDQLIGQNLGEHGKRVGLSYQIDEATGRLVKFNAVPELKTDVYNLSYTYNDAGTLTSIADAPDGGQTAETQCFNYDYRQRLTNSWTPTSQSCTAAPVKTALGGAAPYWNSYTYDAAGNRKTETVHATTDTTRTYTYPASGGAAGTKPHAVTQVATVVGTAAAVNQKYDYTESGSMKCRPTGTAANTCPSTGTTDTAGQALTWNDEGQLATSTDKSGATSFVYDADGNRLIRRDPAGSTLYLPGGQEVRKPTSGTAVGTRYYSDGGETIAVRTAAAGLTWMISDHQGTGTATVNGSTLAVTRRRTLPFGADRGTAPTVWAGDKGFVGGTKDNTGLTHLGAREYDPALGRFISVDPVMDLSQPDQWNGYSYGNDNPVTLSDPSGTKPCASEAGDCSTSSSSSPSKPSKPSKTQPASNPPAQASPAQASTWRNTAGGLGNGAWKTLFMKPIHLPGFYIPWVSDWEYQKTEEWRMGLEGGFGADPTSDAYKRSDTGAQIGIGIATMGRTGVGWLARLGSKGLSALGAKGGAVVAEKVGAAAAEEAGAGSRALEKCAANSFAATTLVLMGDGSRKPIEDVEVGDTVLATDPETREAGPRTVLALHINQDTDLTDLTVRDKNGDTTVVHTTDEHPFWNTTN
jgi:RHS repeat-associated protein